MPRKNVAKLEGDARSIAGDYYYFARKVARRYSVRFPWIADEIMDAATLGLLLAANSYVSGRVRLATYIGFCVERRCLNVVYRWKRRRKSLRDRRPSYDMFPRATRVDGKWVLSAGDSDADAEGQAVVSEIVENLKRHSRPRFRAAIDNLIADGTAEALGREIGVCASYANIVRHGAVKRSASIMRRVFGVEVYGP